VRVVAYDPSRRADVADLMGRVWGERPAVEELEWFYERNPVRPASVLLGEDDDGRLIATVAIAFLRMSIGGEELEVGMPLRVATDPVHRGKGLFGQLQAENESRVADLGIRLLLTVPNAASAPVFLERLGWSRLPSLRIWARLHLLPGHARAQEVRRFSDLTPGTRFGDRVLRDEAWLNWRFADAPRAYTLLENGGYAAVGRRGRLGVAAVVDGGLLGDVAAVASGFALIAAPPPPERRRYALAGYLPTQRTFTVLGKALAPGQTVPARPHFELGDLDFL
jgi:GNAT superfamily N-acetyltransferase